MLRSPMCRIIAVVVLFFSSLVVYSISRSYAVEHFVSASPRQDTFVVSRVIDGDTLILSNGEKVRLTGIDTPESKSNPKALRDSQRSGEDLQTITRNGQQAAYFVKRMIEGKEVRLEFDVRKRDRYGRQLVYVYDVETLKFHPEIKLSEGFFVSPNNEIFLNGSIIRSGYASPMTIPPNVRYADLFIKLYQEARLNRRGLWAQKSR